MTAEFATAEHTHAHEDVCTSACPASPWFEPVPPTTDSVLDMIQTGELPDLVREEEFSIAYLAGKVDSLEKKIDALTEQQSGIAGMLATIVEQVEPTLAKLTEHPMLKMFLGGK